MKKKILGCTILLVVVFQLTPWSLIVTAQFDVNGRVISDDGTILSDVLIYVYTSGAGGGSFVTISSVDPWGYFGIFLGAGSYDLVFKKTGYVPYTTTISGSDTWINIGEVQMTTALQLSTTILNRVTSPGNTLVLPFTLSNAGEEEQECKLNITSPEGWKVKVTDINGELVGLRLPAGVTTTLNLEITVPLNASGENDISLCVSGLTTIDWSLTIIIEEEEIQIAELKAKYPSQSIPLGTTANYELTIENPSQTDELFDLSTSEIPSGWQIVFKAIESPGDRISVNCG